DRFESTGGSTSETLADKSLLVTGENPQSNLYTLVARAPVGGISALRLEALPDARLPGGGPGRDRYGNFVLTGLSIAIGDSKPVPLAPIKADDGSASGAS